MNNNSFNSNSWGVGIPHYFSSDVMTEDDKLNYAIDYIKKTELKNRYIILEENNKLGEIPNLLCEKDEKKYFIVVKCAVMPNVASICFEDKLLAVKQSKEYGAEAYCACVEIGSFDSVRMSHGIALKGDSYHTFYKGLEKLQKKTQEWIDSTIEEINKLIPPKESDIRYSLDISSSSSNDIRFSLPISSDVDKSISNYNEWKTQNKVNTFQEQLMEYIADKGMANQDFYKAAFIDRKLFSTIKNNRFYKPKKQTAVACCFGLGLDFDDAENLLELAGYKLSLAITWDRVIYYCLKKGIHDIDIVNELLYAEGENCF